MVLFLTAVDNKVKVLIIRFSSIGDIVLTTPVIRCLKKQLQGDVEVHYLTKVGYRDLLAENPYITKIHTIDKSTNEVIDQLEEENFDYVVDLHKNLRSSRVKKRLNGLSFSFDKLNVQKWILVNFKINRLPNIHIVDRYLAAVKALGIKNDGAGLDYFLPEGIESTFTEKYPENYIALVLGANHATKKLPEHKLKELLNTNKSNFILISGVEDAAIGKELEKIDPKRIFNACGTTTLNQSAYLIKKATAVITPDTGMMHIAAAFQQKIISVWGNTVPEFGMYPYLKKGFKNNSKIMEVSHLSCRPCSKIGFEQCPKKHFKCMEEIDINKVNALLN